MTNDKRVLNMLKEARKAEERIIPIYTRHLESAVFWTGIDENSVKKAKDILRTLARDSEVHKKAMEYLIKRFNGGDDVIKK